MTDIKNIMISIKSGRTITFENFFKAKTYFNVTRWYGKFEMISRFLELKPLLDDFDSGIADLIPSVSEMKTVDRTFQEMKIIYSVTLRLQRQDLTFWRRDTCLMEFWNDIMSYHLDPNYAPITNSNRIINKIILKR